MISKLKSFIKRKLAEFIFPEIQKLNKKDSAEYAYIDQTVFKTCH